MTNLSVFDNPSSVIFSYHVSIVGIEHISPVVGSEILLRSQNWEFWICCFSNISAPYSASGLMDQDESRIQRLSVLDEIRDSNSVVEISLASDSLGSMVINFLLKILSIKYLLWSLSFTLGRWLFFLGNDIILMEELLSRHEPPFDKLLKIKTSFPIIYEVLTLAFLQFLILPMETHVIWIDEKWKSKFLTNHFHVRRL